EAYGKAIELETTDAGRLTDMNRISYSYLLEGRTEAAIKASEKALKMAKKAGLPDREAAIHAGVRSEAFVMLGDMQNAERSIEECRRIIEESDLDASVKESFLAWAVFREGVIAAKKGDKERAEAKVDQFYALIDADDDVNQVEAHHALVGIVKLEAGDYAAATKHLKKADQNDPYVVYHLALAQNKAGNTAEATELMTKVSNWNDNGPNYATVKVRADNELDKMRAGLD
ncbi:MAG: tetratricopeptide repeat protein, partial [Rhodothermia bacterium]|nr:tetratricopeptide repeat protein [Rhodothermia bacterium]